MLPLASSAEHQTDERVSHSPPVTGNAQPHVGVQFSAVHTGPANGGAETNFAHPPPSQNAASFANNSQPLDSSDEEASQQPLGELGG